ncbi:MAG TPA: hypothetical protein VGN38_02835 [Caulobacteraceae bacterium]|nr:hypothetical protein [Caulobacteraceae bacterium]
MTPTFNHLFSGAPSWLIAAAMVGVIIHVSAGGVGILSGAAAIALRKGERHHRLAGNVFFAAMVTMAAAAGIMATALVALGVVAQVNNLFASLFTLYLVGTAWGTVKRPEGTTGRWEIAAFIAGLGIVGIALFAIAPLLSGPAGRHSGAPWFAPYIFAAVASLAAATDLKVILRGGITGAARVARHLWRMCVAWFVASGSFFLGQQKDMPPAIQDSPVLVILGFAPLLLMLFWLGFVALTRTFKQPLAGLA